MKNLSVCLLCKDSTFFLIHQTILRFFSKYFVFIFHFVDIQHYEISFCSKNCYKTFKNHTSNLIYLLIGISGNMFQA